MSFIAENVAKPLVPAAVEVLDLHRTYNNSEAVNGLRFSVPEGACYGLFGRNGAGKSTTIKCLLNHVRPTSGTVKVFGMDPAKHEVAVKKRVGYVPELVAFYPWMKVVDVLDYHSSFYDTWSKETEQDLIRRFDLDPKKKVSDMSKGMRSQLALICAVSSQPDLLLLDEPTSGLDPVVRREFLQAVIGIFLDSVPGRKTVLVSTHLINEWEGLIDEFTIVDKGRALVSMNSEEARSTHRKYHLKWNSGSIPDALGQMGEIQNRQGGSCTLFTTNYSEEQQRAVESLHPDSVQTEALSLEEIFVSSTQKSRG